MYYIRRESEDITKLSAEKVRDRISSHRNEVQSIMDYVANMIEQAGERHDYTKEKYFKEYLRVLQSGNPIIATKWGQNHAVEERHHFDEKIPYNINLIDVIEHIVNDVVSKIANDRDIFDNLSEELLVEAYKNTVGLILSQVAVEPEEDPKKEDHP